jgi:hypothetical protein
VGLHIEEARAFGIVAQRLLEGDIDALLYELVALEGVQRDAEVLSRFLLILVGNDLVALIELTEVAVQVPVIASDSLDMLGLTASTAVLRVWYPFNQLLTDQMVGVGALAVRELLSNVGRNRTILGLADARIHFFDCLAAKVEDVLLTSSARHYEE